MSAPYYSIILFYLIFRNLDQLKVSAKLSLNLNNRKLLPLFSLVRSQN